MASRIGVVTFPGTCDDRDALRAVEVCGGEPVSLWHADDDLRGVDGVFLPGGFSFGYYLRCGAIASLSPVMAAIARFAADGGPVLGVCNGFQMLCEAGLLPGILRGNHHGRFNCLETDLVVERRSPWTGSRAAGETLRIPIKHGEGAWYVIGDEAERLAAAGQVLLRYGADVNGASALVAGVCNEAGNVFGLMPHPEHAVDALIGSTDGRAVIGGLLEIAAPVPA
ncbi:MAG: phosphoribosylformylglycinamidine synthase subunit PurQ / glutaminase [Gaiellaceae bacterium]|nr:phosphoribosylformylglycinamidine synthase subunit PurQ / glutaminase [Gaiellaceae bacterium]